MSFVMTAALWMGLLIVGNGCGGSGAGQTVTGEPIARPPAEIVKDPKDTYNVTINTFAGQLIVDKLEIEFNRRRGIHEFYGFYRDQYDQMERVGFDLLERVDFLGEMPRELFDQAIIGREQEHLRADQAFTVLLYFRDRPQETFFAIIPKFRGEKDLQLWELPMNNATMVIDYIDFNR
jgi:hypothetical protein